MSEIQATGVLVLLFALRCVVPIAFVAGIGYLMNRLVDHWEQEEKERAAAPTPQPVPKPATGVALPKITVPCWILRNCEPDKRLGCAAFTHSSLPCWVARMNAEGALPAGCPNCPVFQQAQVAA